MTWASLVEVYWAWVILVYAANGLQQTILVVDGDLFQVGLWMFWDRGRV